MEFEVEKKKKKDHCHYPVKKDIGTPERAWQNGE